MGFQSLHLLLCQKTGFHTWKNWQINYINLRVIQHIRKIRYSDLHEIKCLLLYFGPFHVQCSYFLNKNQLVVSWSPILQGPSHWFITKIMSGEEEKLWCSSLCNFLRFLVTPFILRPNILTKPLFSHIRYLYSYFRAKGVSHMPEQNSRQIMLFYKASRNSLALP
jgi:hypothetical protein